MPRGEHGSCNWKHLLHLCHGKWINIYDNTAYFWYNNIFMIELRKKKHFNVLCYITLKNLLNWSMLFNLFNHIMCTSELRNISNRIVLFSGEKKICSFSAVTLH